MTYHLHRQLVYKLKIYGCNVLFGLKVQIDIGDELLVAQATGTGFFVHSLPVPRPLKIQSSRMTTKDLGPEDTKVHLP